MNTARVRKLICTMALCGGAAACVEVTVSAPPSQLQEDAATSVPDSSLLDPDSGARTSDDGQVASSDGADAGTDASATAHNPLPGAVDVLLVIDNSGTMAKKQLRLQAELPRFIQGLVNANATDLHLGVISTNMGGVEDIAGQTQAAIVSCKELGNDGKLQNSVEVARDGVYAMGNREFDGFLGGAEVLAPSPDCGEVGRLPTYQTYSAGIDAATDSVSQALGCVAVLGVRGCPFEQPLEAMWKALAPDGEDELHTFRDETKGNADGFNKGFLRSGALLVVLFLTDEEDCSITSRGTALFGLDAEAKDAWGDLNLRCGAQASNTELIYPVSRYVDALKSLKGGNAERVVVAGIVGVPEQAITSGQTPTQILARADMQYAPDLNKPGFPKRSCAVDGVDAFPPRRIVEAIASLQGGALLHSSCTTSYGALIDKLLVTISQRLQSTPR